MHVSLIKSTMKGLEIVKIFFWIFISEFKGTHRELIAANGKYANLYNMQLRIEDITE